MSASPAKKLQFGPVPLVIGVTGHRDPHPDPGVQRILREKLAALFTELRRKYPRTPFVVLSPLAEGADQLVAEVGHAFGAKLVAPLPLKPELYQRDFAAGMTCIPMCPPLTEPTCLLQPAPREDADDVNTDVTDCAFVLPYVGANTETSVAPDGPARDLQYLLAGVFVATHCQVLIALCESINFDAKAATGGTLDIIHFRLTGHLADAKAEQLLEKLPEPFNLRRSPLDEVETGAVYWLATPRSSAREEVVAAWKKDPPEHVLVVPARPTPLDEKELALEDKLPPEKGERLNERWRHDYAKRSEDALRNLEAFNHDAVKCFPLLDKRLQANRNYLLPWMERPKDKPAEPKAALLPEPLVRTRHVYGVADTLAVFFQGWRFLSLRMLFWYALAAAAMFGVYSHLYETKASDASYLCYYLLIFLLGFGCYWVARLFRFEQRHEDYRALAEGLRVQFFWRLAGLPNMAADHYLRRQRSELDWIRHAMRALSLFTRPLAETSTRLAWIETHWVVDQAKYFAETAPDNHRRLVVSRELGNGFFVMGLALAFWIAWTHAAAQWIQPVMFVALLCAAVPICRKLYRLFRAANFPALPYLFDLLPLVPKKRKKAFKLALNQAHRRLQLRFGFTLGHIPFYLLNLICFGMGGFLLLICLLYTPPFWLRDLWETTLALKVDELEVQIVTTALMVVIAALLHGYGEKMVFAEQSKQYEHMSGLFGIARRRLAALAAGPHVGASVRPLIEELGRDALAENADWLLLHRERPMELVKAG